jgi:hypothetical protein
MMVAEVLLTANVNYGAALCSFFQTFVNNMLSPYNNV